jgi:hypothetical protein
MGKENKVVNPGPPKPSTQRGLYLDNDRVII